jgi:hypothetical protein
VLGRDEVKADATEVTRAAAHAVGLLNELEAVLTGWVLAYDRDEIERMLAPVYAKLDQEKRRDDPAVSPDIETRILRALASGPLYRPTLELIVDATEYEVREALQRLTAEGLVEVAAEIGPATYRRT